MNSRQKKYNTFKNADEETKVSDAKRWLPFRFERCLSNELPQRRAGLLSHMTYSWLSPLMYQARAASLTAEDLFDTPPERGAESNAFRFEKLWHDEVSKRGAQNASVARCLLRLGGSKLLLSSMCICIYGLCAILSPGYFMSELLRYSDGPKTNPANGVMLVVGMVWMEVFRSFFLALAWGLNCEAAVQTTNGVMSAVYRKLMRLDNTREQSPGQMINLFSNDGLRIFEAFNSGAFIIGPVISGLAAAALTVRLVGVWGLLGFAVFYCMVPLQAGLSKIGAILRLQSLAYTDLRVKLTTEAVSSIRLIKQYSWINAFAKNISSARNNERAWLRRVCLINGLLASVPHVIPLLASLATFTGILLSTDSLSVLQAFTFLATLNGLRGTTTIAPVSVKAITDALLAAKRIKAVLLKKEKVPTSTHAATDLADHLAVKFCEASFLWPRSHVSVAIAEKTKADEQQSSTCTLNAITLEIKKGKRYGVCGAVGNGKSSFIAAMAGLIPRTRGELQVRGSVAYVSQQAWIMNATLRDNITFGLPFNEPRYRQVVECCCLTKDVELLQDGDMTEIGDRGVNLSGGQKQRVSLARAVYSNCDLYLLDDPLSAVDAGVAKHIFEKCILGLLQRKTLMIVTHHAQFLQKCDSVILLQSGRVVEVSQMGENRPDTEHGGNLLVIDEVSNGSEVNLLPSERATCNRDGSDGLLKEVAFESTTSLDVVCNVRKGMRKPAHSLERRSTGVPLLKGEFLEKGSISRDSCKAYIRAAGCGAVTLSSLLIVSMTVFSSLAVWWLSFWLRDEAAAASLLLNHDIASLFTSLEWKEACLIAYALCITASVFFLVLKSVSYTKLSMQASSEFHEAILTKVLWSPMQFFDTTPTGQIMNRFSKDMDEMDSMFPLAMESVIQSFLSVISSLVLVSIGMPYAVAFIVPLFAILIILYWRLTPGARQLKRLEHSARSRWFSHIASTVNGLTTIRAYGKEEQFLDRFYQLTESYTMSLALYNNSVRWLAVRFDAIHVANAAAAGCLVALLPFDAAIPSLAGLTITNALSLAGVLQHTVKLSIEAECRFLSAERLWSYSKDLKTEDANGQPAKIPDPWPSAGNIVFDKVTLRYRPDLPEVLHGISFSVASGEKVGIVGRTGSGKSSLGTVLFRLAEIESGQVTIDGLDIRNVPLPLLRSKLSIIPQEPVLFLGSLRYNLDPLGKYNNEDLEHSLSRCKLSFKDGRFSDGLETHIAEGGDNLSLGERQLVCMARVLLSRNKILMMDEATAAMDVTTDEHIMDTITNVFSTCTVLIIAHRLRTVLQCDRVMVVDKGQIVEFDTPKRLLEDERSAFYQMLRTAASNDSP